MDGARPGFSLGSGTRGSVGEGGGEEPGPLGGREGEVPGGGVFGVADRRPTGEFGDLNALLALSAVAALSEVCGYVRDLHTVLVLAAIAALPEYEIRHVSLSMEAAASLMKAADLAVLRAAPWTSLKVALYWATSSISSMKSALVTVPT